MNFRGQRRGPGRVEATLELTPLIDVVFLLLIFFVMTASPASSAVDRLDLDLPEAATGEAAESTELRVVVHVFASGEIRLQEGDDASEQVVRELEPALAEIFARRPDAAIWIRGDVDASHGAVIELLDSARSVGFRRVHMAVRPGS